MLFTFSGNPFSAVLWCILHLASAICRLPSADIISSRRTCLRSMNDERYWILLHIPGTNREVLVRTIHKTIHKTSYLGDMVNRQTLKKSKTKSRRLTARLPEWLVVVSSRTWKYCDLVYLLMIRKDLHRIVHSRWGPLGSGRINGVPRSQGFRIRILWPATGMNKYLQPTGTLA